MNTFVNNLAVLMLAFENVAPRRRCQVEAGTSLRL
jgi:hypothetical protein